MAKVDPQLFTPRRAAASWRARLMRFTESPTIAAGIMLAATDIAFALGILSILGERVPSGLRVLKRSNCLDTI